MTLIFFLFLSTDPYVSYPYVSYCVYSKYELSILIFFTGKQYSKTPPSVSRGSSEQGASGGGKKSPYKFFGSKNTTSATGTPASRQNSTTSFLRNGNDSDS